MDIYNLVTQYRNMRKECKSKFDKNNPDIIYSVVLISTALVEIIAAFISFKSIYTAILIYAATLIVIIFTANKMRKKEKDEADNYYNPYNAFRIKLLCILLLRNNIDYKNEKCLDNIILSIDEEVQNRVIG